MGYYFEKAKSVKDLLQEQKDRYETLRSAAGKSGIHPVLEYRIERVREYIGPISSGEVWSALEELVQDAFVVWILAGEDPDKVEWADPKDLVVPTPPPTEEEKHRAQEWSENFMRQLREQEEGRRLPPRRTFWQWVAGFLHRT